MGEGSSVCLKAMTEGAHIMKYLKEGYKDCCRSKNILIYKFVAVRVLHSLFINPNHCDFLIMSLHYY